MKKRLDDDIDLQLAREAKAIVAIAFRNGPIENVHAGKQCPTCEGSNKYSRITQDEIKEIMKYAVDNVYALLWLREHAPDRYELQVRSGNTFTKTWDEPLQRKSASKGRRSGK